MALLVFSSIRSLTIPLTLIKVPTLLLLHVLVEADGSLNPKQEVVVSVVVVPAAVLVVVVERIHLIYGGSEVSLKPLTAKPTKDVSYRQVNELVPPVRISQLYNFVPS